MELVHVCLHVGQKLTFSGHRMYLIPHHKVADIDLSFLLADLDHSIVSSLDVTTMGEPGITDRVHPQELVGCSLPCLA